MSGNEGSLPPPRQGDVFQSYLRLDSIADASFSGTLGGRLLLCVGGGQEAEETAIAAAIAGGAVLTVDSDSGRLKAGVRDGAYDFIVNTLDESLRILKNELRKKTPVSVGLSGDAPAIVSEMAERGVQPDVIVETSEPEESERQRYQEALLRLTERGAQVLVSTGDQPADSDGSHIVWTAPTSGDLRRMDKIVLQTLPSDDRTRRQWLERAGGYLGSRENPERVFFGKADERIRVLDAFQRARSTGTIGSVSMRWQEPDSSWKTITF